jgi:hypothetical protein
MATLPEAISASDDESAAYETAGGVTVVVRRIVGPPGVTDTEESYAVSVQRGAQPPHDRFDVDSLPDALARMRAWNLPDFDPESNAWRPA